MISSRIVIKGKEYMSKVRSVEVFLFGPQKTLEKVLRHKVDLGQLGSDIG